MQNKPQLSVLMTVYNGDDFLHKSIDSILDQTYTNFEFIIVDDGSRDRTWRILKEYEAKDQRIVLLRNGTNMGVPRSSNKGLGIARGQYVARMDADDISMPERLAVQVAFLDEHPEVGVVGSFVQLFDLDETLGNVWHYPTRHALIKWSLCFHSPLAHPSVVFRRAIVEHIGGYDDAFPASHDRDLWLRLSSVTRFANLPKVYLKYRDHHPNSISKRLRDVQIHNSAKTGQRMMFNILGWQAPFEISYGFRVGRFETPDKAVQAACIIKKLYHAFVTQEQLSILEKYAIHKDATQRICRLAQPWWSNAKIRHKFLMMIFRLSPLGWVKIIARRAAVKTWHVLKHR